MCVRTLTGNEVESVPTDLPIHHELEGHSSKKSDKLTKAKEKYMKLHDEMILREKSMKIDNEQKPDSDLSVSKISETFLADCESTIKLKTFCSKVSSCYLAWQQTKSYKIIFYTSQPAHVIMIAAVLCVASALLPTSERINMAGQPHSRITSIIYLVSFVVHFGSQIWMTFVSGLSLYFALPRHVFSEVQRVLFPRYFTINACLSLTTLLIFIKHHPTHTWDSEVAIQVGGMCSAFFLELLIRLYLTPPLMRLIVQKNALERAAGLGNEIGRHNFGGLKHCPHYMKIHGAFRRIHTSIAIGNMFSMACTILHLHYIASKLCVL